ncbi:MAG: hypothetical protein ACKV2U_03625 [Bryobacteraceae bacterium]
MAVENKKSTQITNADALDGTKTAQYIAGGTLREVVGTVETAAADDALSVYRMVRVPSNARITSILLASDAITGASASDVGVYQTAANGGAVVDADEFANDVDISSATAWTEVINQAVAAEKSDVEKMLWEKIGETTDPKRDYDICVTVNDVTAAGTIAMKVRYTTNQ